MKASMLMKLLADAINTMGHDSDVGISLKPNVAAEVAAVIHVGNPGENFLVIVDIETARALTGQNPNVNHRFMSDDGVVREKGKAH